MKRNPKIILTLFALFLIIVPFAVNSLMSFRVTKVYGDINAWIGFLGGYIGAIISGFITFLGVLLTLEFTKSEAEKDKLPAKIDNLEECLDLIEDNVTKLNYLNHLDVLETLHKQALYRNTVFYLVSSQFNLAKTTTDIDDYTRVIEKQIRKFLIKVNSNAYIKYRIFSEELKNNYTQHIDLIDKRLISFCELLMEEYMDTHPEYIVSGHLSNIPISNEHRKILNKIISDLYYEEKKYISSLIETFSSLEEELSIVLQTLRKQLDY